MCASISARSTLYVSSMTNIGGELAPIVRQGERLRRGVEPGRGGRRWFPMTTLGTPNSTFEPDGPRQRVPKDECGRPVIAPTPPRWCHHARRPLNDSSNRIAGGGAFIAIALRRAAAAAPVPRVPELDRNFPQHFAQLQRVLLLCYRSA